MEFMVQVWKYIKSKIRIREIAYLYNSRVDFIDAWISLLTTLTGFVLIINAPLENLPIYEHLLVAGVTSDGLGFFSVLVGLSNLIRVFLPFKVNVFCASVMKSLSFSIYLLLFFTVVGNPPLPVATVCYFMISMLSLDNIMRTR